MTLLPFDLAEYELDKTRLRSGDGAKPVWSVLCPDGTIIVFWQGVSCIASYGLHGMRDTECLCLAPKTREVRAWFTSFMDRDGQVDYASTTFEKVRNTWTGKVHGPFTHQLEK